MMIIILAILVVVALVCIIVWMDCVINDKGRSGIVKIVGLVGLVCLLNAVIIGTNEYKDYETLNVRIQAEQQPCPKEVSGRLKTLSDIGKVKHYWLKVNDDIYEGDCDKISENGSVFFCRRDGRTEEMYLFYIINHGKSRILLFSVEGTRWQIEVELKKDKEDVEEER